MSGCESIENYKLQVLFIPTGSKWKGPFKHGSMLSAKIFGILIF
jgi:hypothetical protein